jgi:putative superfamily III holin-X
MTPTRSSEDLKEQPWVDVLKTLAEELRDFVQQEMQLVKTELSSKVKQAGIGAGMFGAAGFMGFLAVGTLTAAVILALALVLPAWAAALIVSAFYGLVAAVLALVGRKKVKAATPLAPEQAIRTVQATKEQVQQAWERGSRQAGPARTHPSGSPDGATQSTAAEAAAEAAPASAPPVEEPASPIRTESFRTTLPRY